jgi:hypothetical protein
MIKPKKHDQQIIVVGYQDNNIIFSSHWFLIFPHEGHDLSKQYVGTYIGLYIDHVVEGINLIITY